MKKNTKITSERIAIGYSLIFYRTVMDDELTEKTSALNVAISLFVEHLTAKVALFCGFCGNSTLSKSVILYP